MLLPIELSLIELPLIELLLVDSIPLPDLEEDDDFPVLESEVLEEVLVLDFAFVPVGLLSEEVDLPLLLEEGLELEEDDPMSELPWLIEESIVEPLWLELPDVELPDMLPDWLDD